MRFTLYIPCDVLKPYIRAFAISESETENMYKVLPGTELVIGFQYRGNLAHLDGGKAISLTSAGLTGIHDSYRVFRNAAGTGTVLVYFNEGCAASFFREPLHLLFRESVSLDHFMLRSELLLLEEQLCEAGNDLQKINLTEKFLLSRLHQVKPDQLILAALALIHQHKGNIRIQTLCEQLHISQSPLEKRFRKTVGTSPKKFASIVRLKHAIGQYDPQGTLTDLGYEAGFYDQAHFIREFKNFTGETPENFFNGNNS